MALRAAAVLLAVEGIATIGYACWVAVGLFREPPDQLAPAITTAGLVVAVGVLLGAAGRGLARAHRWSRAVAILGQLLLAAFSYDLMSRGAPAAGVGIVVAVATLVLIVMPRSTVAFTDDTDPQGTGSQGTGPQGRENA